MNKLFSDFFPIILFFLAYKFYDLFIATAVLIVATLAQVGWNRLYHKKYEKMHLVTLALVLLFGGATLLLQDEMFIKWKVSVINWLFGLAFLLSQFIGSTPLVKRMMQGSITLPEPVWTKLNLGWSVFFILVGCVNLYVVYHYSTETWVNFKLFGMLGLTFVFIILQGIFLARYIKDEEPPADRQKES
ncbi:MAG: septation protein A [Gammaproteobacteria bacterium]|nr:MAG: septation protein A [Gammaproteobacteria bacterium]